MPYTLRYSCIFFNRGNNTNIKEGIYREGTYKSHIQKNRYTEKEIYRKTYKK
jgi:hypothetical protein